MSDRHTPGPWHVRADALSGETYIVAAGQLVARIQSPTNGKANARLIAAAPELLAAVHALLTMCDQHIPDAVARSFARQLQPLLNTYGVDQ